MIKLLHHIDQRERLWKRISLFALISNLCVVGASIYWVQKAYRDASERVYILVNDHELAAARSGDIRNSVDIVAKAHIRRFHELFWTLEPDPEYIQQNVEERALFLVDDSGYHLYQHYKSQGYYREIIAGNYSSSISTDSIVLNLSKYPYSFVYYGVQSIVRQRSILYRNIITEGRLSKVSNTEKNDRGFRIENWRLLDDSDRRIINR